MQAGREHGCCTWRWSGEKMQKEMTIKKGGMAAEAGMLQRWLKKGNEEERQWWLQPAGDNMWSRWASAKVSKIKVGEDALRNKKPACMHAADSSHVGEAAHLIAGERYPPRAISTYPHLPASKNKWIWTHSVVLVDGWAKSMIFCFLAQ